MAQGAGSTTGQAPRFLFPEEPGRAGIRPAQTTGSLRLTAGSLPRQPAEVNRRPSATSPNSSGLARNERSLADRTRSGPPVIAAHHRPAAQHTLERLMIRCRSSAKRRRDPPCRASRQAAALSLVLGTFRSRDEAWICARVNDTCSERISMPHSEYGQIRSHPTRFLVFPSEATRRSVRPSQANASLARRLWSG